MCVCVCVVHVHVSQTLVLREVYTKVKEAAKHKNIQHNTKENVPCGTTLIGYINA